MIGKSDIKFVFSSISQAGNLGFVARLLGNFPGYPLCLVSCVDHLAEEARRFATHSVDVLEEAKTEQSLLHALQDCDLVIGTTARSRKNFRPLFSIRDLGQLLASFDQPKKIAFLFGNETSGLSNQELSLCNAYLTIPTDPKKSSINISHAFALVLYELEGILTGSVTGENPAHYPNPHKPLAPAKILEIEGFKGHLWQLLEKIGFLHQIKEPSLRENISAVLSRSKLSQKDVRVLRAIVNKALVYIGRLEKGIKPGAEKDEKRGGRAPSEH